MSFVELLKAERDRAKAEAAAQKRRKAGEPDPNDPWLIVLKTIKAVPGPYNHDGVGCVTAEQAFTELGVPSHERAKNYKRLVGLMPEAGWTQVTQRGYGILYWMR